MMKNLGKYDYVIQKYLNPGELPVTDCEKGMNSPNSHLELHSAPLYTNRLTHCFDRLHNNAVRIQRTLLEVKHKFDIFTSTTMQTMY